MRFKSWQPKPPTGRNADASEFNDTMYYTNYDQIRPKYKKLVCKQCSNIVIGDPTEDTIKEHQKEWPKHEDFEEMFV